MLVEYFDNKGKEIKSKLEVRDEVFDAKINKVLLAQAVRTYLANRRQSNAHTKNRGEVSGGGKKPWKQKGTGKARAGSSRSPIWKGGGVTYGPTNEINYKKTLNKKMRKIAMVSSLSMQAKAGNVVVFQDLKFDSAKTQDLLKILGKLKDEKVLMIQKDADQFLVNSAHNIETLNLEVVNSVNYYDILNAAKVVILESSLESIYNFWGTKKAVKKETVKKETVKKEVKPKTVKSTK